MEGKDISQDLTLIINRQKVTPSMKKVLISSIKLFSQYGYNGVSTSRIAQEAEVSEATVFKYFKNKKGLLEAIIQPIIASSIPQYENLFANILESANHYSLKNLINYVVEDRAEFLENNQEIIKIILSELITNYELRKIMLEHLQTNHQHNAQKIYEVFKRTDELDDAVTYQSILQTIMGQLIMYFVQNYLFNAKSTQLDDVKYYIYKSLHKDGSVS